MIPSDPSEIPRMRISDADRDRAASLLGSALADGRLSPEEHSARLDAVFAAKTHEDIVPIVRDLPGAAAALAAQADSLALPGSSGALVPARYSARMISVFSGTRRKGVWQVPAEIRVVSVFGGTELDLRDALLSSREVRIRAYCILGGTEITVPPEMHVIDDGIAILGGREIPPDSEESARQDAPVLRLTGVSLLGGLMVRRKRRKGDGTGKGKTLRNA